MNFYTLEGCKEFGDPNKFSWLRREEVQAWALKLKATVEKVEHNRGCAAVEFDGFAPVILPRRCNCPRGDLLREIEEVLK